jgi:ABC-2 type transport system permease protein
VFFSIFAVIFGGRRNVAASIDVMVVDQDRNVTSQRLIEGLTSEGSLVVATRPNPKKGETQPEYTALTAEAAVKAGASPEVMAGVGTKYMDRFAGGLTPEQHKRIDDSLDRLRRYQSQPNASRQSGSGALVSVKSRDNRRRQQRESHGLFLRSAIGVMFLLFTASGAAGSLLDEVEDGTLDRVLSSHVTMTTLRAGKPAYSALLAFLQLTVTFLWAWAVFRLDLFSHVPGFVVMGVSTALAVAAFGILLASVCGTRAQFGRTLHIVDPGNVFGWRQYVSTFPLASGPLQKAGLLTINAWAIDGFTKVFWRDEPVSNLLSPVLVPLTIGVSLFAIARKFAQRWDYT